ncbi:tetratricopeptide repeat protein [Corallococcus terminator]
MALDLRLRITESGGRAGPTGEESVPAHNRTMQVRLEKDWLRYRETIGTDVLLDFARRRRIVLDEAVRTYREESLFATVGFRHMELANRELGRSVIAAGKGDTSEFEPVMVEHHLSVLDKSRGRTIDTEAPRSGGLRGFFRSVTGGSKRSDIAVASEQGHTVFATAAGRRLFSFSDEGMDAEPEQVRQFVRFLRYHYLGHPLILERLASGNRIPRDLHYFARQPFESQGHEVSLRVHTVDVVPDAALPLEGHCRVLRSNEDRPVNASIERVLLGEVPDTEEVVTRRMAEAQQSLRVGRRLEGALTLLELTLEADVSLPELGSLLQQETDVHVQRLREALTQPPRNEAEARAVVSTYVELRKSAGNRAHVLNTFQAATHRALREDAEARELLLVALEVNPFLAGAYKDLGDIYLSEYATWDAWLCWEAVRKLAPEHRLLKDVNAWEDTLAAEHPEYF